MTPSDRLTAAAAIAQQTATNLAGQRDLLDPSIPAVFKFAATQLGYAAESVGGLSGVHVESIFADELACADALIGVTA